MLRMGMLHVLDLLVAAGQTEHRAQIELDGHILDGVEPQPGVLARRA